MYTRLEIIDKLGIHPQDLCLHRHILKAVVQIIESDHPRVIVPVYLAGSVKIHLLKGDGLLCCGRSPVFSFFIDAFLQFLQSQPLRKGQPREQPENRKAGVLFLFREVLRLSSFVIAAFFFPWCFCFYLLPFCISLPSFQGLPPPF